MLQYALIYISLLNINYYTSIHIAAASPLYRHQLQLHIILFIYSTFIHYGGRYISPILIIQFITQYETLVKYNIIQSYYVNERSSLYMQRIIFSLYFNETNK